MEFNGHISQEALEQYAMETGFASVHQALLNIGLHGPRRHQVTLAAPAPRLPHGVQYTTSVRSRPGA
jgi:hypothetical protein